MKETKDPDWREADQSAFYKHDKWVELESNKNQIQLKKANLSERDLKPRTPHF